MVSGNGETDALANLEASVGGEKDDLGGLEGILCGEKDAAMVDAVSEGGVWRAADCEVPFEEV